MKTVKWLFLFAIAFLVAWILIFTFNQEPFKIKVPAKMLFYTTPPVAIYIYLLSAFTLGICAGLWVALYNYIAGGSKQRRLAKSLTKAEQELTQTKSELESCKAELYSLKTMASPRVDDPDLKDK